jgi:ribonuclease VapC
MILCDTSALIAILKNEPDARRYREAIAGPQSASLPASCYLETSMVASYLREGRRDLDQLIEVARITCIPLDEAIARRAADAFAHYGRGTGHPAALNFGDCIAYATAMHLDVPLLFKGDDFRHTDVKVAL